MGLFDRIIKGGPEYQKRKAEEKAIKADAEAARLQGYKVGLMKGARKRGEAEGYAKGSGKGGLGGFMERAAGGMKGFESMAGGMIGDMNLEGIGGGLNTGFDLSGGSGGSRKRRRSHSKRTSSHKRKR